MGTKESREIGRVDPAKKDRGSAAKARGQCCRARTGCRDQESKGGPGRTNVATPALKDGTEESREIGQVDSESNDESRTLGPGSTQNRLRPTLPRDQGAGMRPARSVDRHALDSPVGTRKIELAALARDCDTGTNLKVNQRLSRSTTQDLLRPVSRHDSDASPPRRLSRDGRVKYVWEANSIRHRVSAAAPGSRAGAIEPDD